MALSSSLEHYDTIGDMRSQGVEAYDKTLKVHGHLLQTPEYDSARDIYTFDLFDVDDDGEITSVEPLTVIYEGRLPDQLAGEIERIGVTAEGQLHSDEYFYSEKLLVACPSRYESR